MYKFEENKEFLEAVAKLAHKHNIQISDILTIAENTEKNNILNLEDAKYLQDKVGIPLGMQISRREICERFTDCKKFQQSIIAIASQDYTFEKLDTFPNFIWVL